MRTYLFVLGAVCAATLCGQVKGKGKGNFSWQDACFKNPGAPFCPGHDFAIKKPAPEKNSSPRSVVRNPTYSAPRTANPSTILVGGLDWRFADPFADELAGFNFQGLATSPIAHRLIAQLGARHGIADAEIQKIFDRLADVEQVAVSVTDGRMVAMITGHATESAFPALEAGFKAVPVPGHGMLIGHADAVDQALSRMATNNSPNELILLAEGRQSDSDFWAIGSAKLVGLQAMSAGVKRFLLTVWIQDQLISDLAFEFYAAPSQETIQNLQTTMGALTVEGNAVHLRTAMEDDELQQKVAQLTDSPLGERLATLVEAARYLPERPVIPKSAKPVIYGLDDGPRVVNQDAR